MKKLLILIAIISLTFSCKNAEEKKTEKINNTEVKPEIDTLDHKIYEGDFVYFADAAILKGKNFTYSVALNEKMHELNNQVKAFKKEDADMVPVMVKGIVTNKPKGEEGLDKILTITEIIKVGK